MFQVEPIFWLQSALSWWPLSWLMWLVSLTGYTEFYAVAVAVIAFGFSLRRGLLLLYLLLACVMVTDALKAAFALPRPWFVDRGVGLPHHLVPLETTLEGGGGDSFWGLPENAAIAGFPATVDSFGMPSTHCCSAVVFWGGLAALFRRPVWTWAAGVMIGLMPFSRMYLGRHFLGDALAGLALGAVLLWLGLRLWSRAPLLASPLLSSPALRRLAVAAFLVLVPLGLLALPGVAPHHAGYLLGLNLAVVLCLRQGLPVEGERDAASFGRRAGRVALALGLFVLAQVLVKLAASGLGLTGGAEIAADFLRGTLGIFALLWGTVTLSRRWGWYAAAPQAVS